MMGWIGFTVFAALMQSVRTAAQKQLAGELDASVVAWIRFVFGLPFALILAYSLLGQQSQLLPLPAKFFGFAVVIAVSQLVATWLMVILLTRRNFAIGSTLVKSEALFTGIFGLIFFAETISALGWLAILLGLAGLQLASFGKFSLRWSDLFANIDSVSARLGLAAGVFFAVASVCIRQANLSLTKVTDPMSQAVITLSVVLTLQSLMGAAYVCSRHFAQVKLIAKHFKISVFIGLSSMLGSFGWFSAYAMQNAAFVKTVGQIEFVFTLLITWFYFRETIKTYEYWAIFLVALSTVLIIWAA